MRYFLLMGLALLPLSASAATQAGSQETATPEQIAQLKAGKETTLEWLNLNDRENYRESLNSTSEILRSKINAQAWLALMDSQRKPLGRVITRQLEDGNLTYDPPGLPAGTYMWIKFKTTFANGASGVETVTLHLENGAWKVLTYGIKSN